MLEHLVRYAERKGLGDDPCFEAKYVKWSIALGNDGSFRGLSPLGNPDDKGWKGKLFPKAARTPGGELQAGGKSHFLSESAETVLLLFPERSKPNKTLQETKASIKEKHDYFLKLIEEAHKSGVRILAPIVYFLTDNKKLETARQELAGEKKFKPTDVLSFDIGGKCVLEGEDWHTFWRKKRNTSENMNQKTGPTMPCLATGVMVVPLNTHGKVKGVWGGNPIGASLIANDKDAFQSYGLEQAYNAPVSAAAESRYLEAMRDLIKHAVPLGGLQFIYWTREETKADPVALVREGEEGGFDFFGNDEKLREGGFLAALKAVRDGGYRPQGYENNQFYGCALSGNGGRVVIRDWWETSLTDVLQNVIKWFNDLEIANCRAPKFGALLYALVHEDLKKELSTHIPIQLMRSALRGLPLPRAVLGKALHRYNIDLIREGEVRVERVALIKAFLNRVRKESDPTMTTELSKNETDHAYRCGRLLAVFEKIQRASRPDLNAGLVQRYYGAASSTPALVMPRLFKLSKHHLATLAGGLAEYFQKQIEEITDIKKMGTTFKRTLTLEEQGRFALGYYHQRAQRKDNDIPDIQQSNQ